MFKIDELARERRDRFDTRSARPRQKLVENSRRIPRKNMPINFQGEISSGKITPLFAINFYPSFKGLFNFQNSQIKMFFKSIEPTYPLYLI